MLGDTHNDKGFALGVVLCCVDGAKNIHVSIHFFYEQSPFDFAHVLMQLEALEHAMLGVDPGEVSLDAGDQLGHKGAGDAVADVHERLAGVCLGVFEGLAEVAWVGEHGGAVGCWGVEVFLLGVGLIIYHVDGWCEDYGSGVRKV